MEVDIAKNRRADRKEKDTNLVAVDHLRHWPSKVSDVLWQPAKQNGQKKVTDPPQARSGILITFLTWDQDLYTDPLPSNGTYSIGPSTQRPDTEETEGAVGLSRPQSSDVSEMNKANVPNEKKENKQSAAAKDSDTPQPAVNAKKEDE